jgi:hypothetical protein
MNGDGSATGRLASRKRLPLAAYLDYLLFGAPWTLGLYLLGVRESLTLWKFLAYGLLEALLFSRMHWWRARIAAGRWSVRRLAVQGSATFMRLDVGRTGVYGGGA